jgi:hypothetical protein
MTKGKTLYQSVRAWAEKAIGPLTVVRDASRPGPTPGVWEVVRETDGERYFVKIAPRPVFYTRETFAYRSAVPFLGAARAPRLVASTAQHLALILTALAGTPLSRLELTDAQRQSAHRQAGVLLSDLHQAGKLNRVTRAEAAAAVPSAADGAQRSIEAAGDRMTAEEQKLVRTRADELRFVGRVPLGLIHGSARERHLLWTDRSQPMALINYERARFAALVQDFVPMACGPWTDNPRLRDAFFTGYGRCLTGPEERALVCLATVHAASRLAWGVIHDDREVTQRARATLARLAEEGAA